MRGEVGGAVDDGGVDDLPLAGAPGHVQRRQAADDEVERAAAEVADEVERDLRRPAGPADRVQGPGDGDVADVVAGGAGQRPLLAPAGHPPVDEGGVARQRGLRPDAEPFGDPGTPALDQDGGPVGQPEDHLGPVGVLQVNHDRPLAPVEQVPPRVAGRQRARLRSVDPDDVGSQVGQQHRRERGGADPGELQDPDPGQRAAHAAPPDVSGVVGGRDATPHSSVGRGRRPPSRSACGARSARSARSAASMDRSIDASPTNGSGSSSTAASTGWPLARKSPGCRAATARGRSGWVAGRRLVGARHRVTGLACWSL